MEPSEVLITFTITSGIGLLLALAKLCYKSKCKNIECCGGLIKVERDITAEIELDEREPPSPRPDTNNESKV
jgi:hypothetical protein